MKADLLYIGMEDWDGVWRRSQNIATRLAKRNPERNLLFVENPFGVANAIKRGRIRTLLHYLNRRGKPRPIQDCPNIHALKPVTLWPVSMLSKKTSDEVSFRRQIKAAERRLGITKRFLWIKPYYAAHLLGNMNECGSLYDVGDDWTALIENPALRKVAVRDDAYLTSNADHVVVVSKSLFEAKKAYRDTVHLIPNGADIEAYSAIKKGQIKAHPSTHFPGRLVIGHTGTIDSRIDIDLVIEVARLLPQSIFVFVGPINEDVPGIQRLHAEPNIKLTGPVHYHELPAVMEGFDVCIVPRKIGDFTNSQNPLKLWEYFASGLPVVSTPVAGFEDYPAIVEIESRPHAFSEAIQNALKEDPARPAQRRKEALNNSWDSRIEEIMPLLSN